MPAGGVAALAARAVAGTTLGAWIRARRPAVTAGHLFLAQTAALVLFPSPGSPERPPPLPSGWPTRWPNSSS